MPTNARIIFRGLTAFIWDESQKKMAAVLVDGPLTRPQKLPADVHQHVPRVSWIGHKSGNPRKTFTRVPQAFKGTLRFKWTPSLSASRVYRDPDFDEFVPSFEKLGASTSYSIRDPGIFNYRKAASLSHPAVAVVLCDRGDIEVTDLVRFWRSTHRQNGPVSPKVRQKVAFLGVSGAGTQRVWAGLASECTLRMTHDDPDAKLTIQTADDGDLVTLEAMQKKGKPKRGNPARHDLFEEDIEVLITNYSGRVREPLPFSTHYQWFFDMITGAPSGPSKATFDAQVDEYERRCASSPGQNWGKALRNYADDLFDPSDPTPKYPFPYIENPLDAMGRQIKDWDDRDLCPLIWGEGGG